MGEDEEGEGGKAMGVWGPDSPLPLPLDLPVNLSVHVITCQIYLLQRLNH